MNSFRDRWRERRIRSDTFSTKCESGTLKIKLQNRQNVERQLREYLEKVTLSPRLIRVICDGKIDAEFSKCLAIRESSLRSEYVWRTTDEARRHQCLYVMCFLSCSTLES